MEKNARVTITSSVPFELWEECIKNGWKWQEIFIRGVQARKEFPAFLERMRDFEAENTQLRNKLQRLAMELYELKESGKNAMEKQK